ncbi:MAG: DUF2723 domain-containing protein [Bacteroidetes bacterium]|nr:DUF2723 domain-containing protein [Bacteroidota bacterium]
MKSAARLRNIAGWIVFGIAFIVYFFSAERTGSLWDCGEFITGAYKLQVVHPPGAAMFLLIGRMFTMVADVFSDNPEHIAFSINLLSGLCSAFAAMFIAWTTGILGKLAIVGREGTPSEGQSYALAGAALVAGLATAFTSSVWFSAVEGEVYAMSTFFTALTLWAMIKWYNLPDTPQSDRWIIFAIYSAGLSIGVHLLSILTFPALAMFYYFKKYKNHTLLGVLASAAVGVLLIVGIQLLIITGIPKLWAALELMMVNGLGMPFHTGVIPLLLIIGAVLYFGLRYSHKHSNAILQYTFIGATLVVIGFSTIGVVVIRANANTPINMNNPSDPMRLIPYLNREQYGERALLKGPNFDARPVNSKTTDRYGQVGDRYEIVDQKVSYEYKDSEKILFPRMGDYTQGRPDLYRMWMGGKKGKPTMFDNVKFLFQYQVAWMYWRYFMWNFAGRQNGDQGYYSWDPSDGNWMTGIKFLDSGRLYNQDELPETMRKHKARNKYFMLPFLFGLLGLFFHFQKNRSDALGLLSLFIITGIGIIIYSNQPPNEPRERDYVLAGSFFTYCIWIGMGVLALYEVFRERFKLSGPVSGIVASLVILIAPLLMGFQNFDDHSRRHHKASRDYAANFLNSCEPNSIIFTYGDNDTYPLWYAQEVENIRTDVRVVNLSLIAVDWYIDQLRRKVNDSPAIKMTVPREAYRGKKRNQVFYYNTKQARDQYNPALDEEMSLQDLIQFIGEDHPLGSADRKIESYYYTKKVFITVDKQKVLANGTVNPQDTGRIVSKISFTIGDKDKSYLIKDELAVLDILASNLFERPVYFAVTTRPEKMFGLGDYMQLEGLGLQIVPVKSQSEPQYGIMGNGRVNADVFFDNVMNKFQWGNFDKYELFVDRSYAPSVQSHRVGIMRAARNLIAEGDNERAIALVDKYFEAFPHMNFPYDYNAFYLISVYLQADAYEKAKPHLEILANETADHLNFYFSLDPDDLQAGFSQDYSLVNRTKDDVLRAVQATGDTVFIEELKTLFAPYELSADDLKD